MVVIGTGVEMGSHQHLILAAPHLLGQFHADAVTFLGSDFAALETLVSVISDIAACFTKAFLYGKHF